MTTTNITDEQDPYRPEPLTSPVFAVAVGPLHATVACIACGAGAAKRPRGLDPTARFIRVHRCG